MKRYIHNPAVFGTFGNKMASALQDVGIPILDILVRESIQNSLDAADNDCDSPCVLVEYKIDDFNVSQLTQELEGLSSLDTRTDLPCRAMSIRDRYTVGLTGDFTDEKSNLKKLTTGFMNNQEAEGAGGSWGIGKTIYYRIGAGLVIYYSRVQNTNKEYESLLCAVLVEDPNSDTALIPNIDDNNKFGIVMWGKPMPGRTDGVVQETRDPEIINRILGAFNIDQYESDETGTTVIIPFIDEESLLANNICTADEEEIQQEPMYWQKSIEEYLKIAVQRWYPARLNNLDYGDLSSNKALCVYVNDNLIDSKVERSFCKILRTLYQKAVLAIAGDAESDKIKFKDLPISLAPIGLNSIEGREVGQLAYIKIPVRELDTEYVSFYTYINQTVPKGTPIIVYSRKPGLIVSYETVSSKWIPSVKCSEDEYLIGYFVLKSSARLRKADMDMEAYIRSCEQAIHNSWNDKQVDKKFNPQPSNYTPTFVKRIREQVSGVIQEAITPSKNTIVDRTKDLAYGNLFGKIFLKNFLTTKNGRPTGRGEENGSPGLTGTTVRTRRSISASYEISYTPNSVAITVHIKTCRNKKCKGCNIELNVLSGSGSMSAIQWHNEVGTLLPFQIKSIRPDLKYYDGDNCTDCNVLKFEKKYSPKKELYGITLGFHDSGEHSFACDIVLELNVRTREAKPSIYVSDLE